MLSVDRGNRESERKVEKEENRERQFLCNKQKRKMTKKKEAHQHTITHSAGLFARAPVLPLS